MKSRSYGALAAMLALLSSCGGSGGGSGGGSITVAPTTPAPTATSTPTPTAAAGCSLRERQDWAAATLREWYLFPETLPASLDPAPYPTVDTYIDALTATARGQRRDRYFTYLTSIASEDAYYDSGESAGFGFRLGTNAAQGRLFVVESFENAPALAAGIDRGAEIVAIGTSAANLRNVSEILASEGSAGLSTALGANTAGISRVLRVTDAAGTRNVTVTKATFDLLPVSSRYGAKIIDDGGRRVGYINLRSFIGTADQGLRQGFAQLRAAGVTDVIVDLRYNGGGLISIAELFGDLLGRDRSSSDVFSYTTFRPEKASSNRTRTFAAQPESIAPTRIAFIGTGGTASASELVINGFIPYLGTRMALVGTNTYGKPVGQVAIDRAACDDRLRVVALAVQNSARSAAYYDGLASVVPNSCQAGDDITYQLGDPREGSTRAALDFLAGRSCAPIGGARLRPEAVADVTRQLVQPERPDTIQREVPGAF